MLEPVKDLIFQAIEKHANSRPRSLQTMVGPSDLGDTCDHCLSAKLAGWQKRTELAWLPYIGTAVHEYVAQAFTGDEWISETSSMVGHVEGMPVWGTADLFHIPTRTVVDFKVVGQATLTAAKRGEVREQYRRQVHLYARGLEAKHVAIMFLPRSSPDLYRSTVWWEQDYDQNVAMHTIARANLLAFGARTASDTYQHIKSLPRAVGCYDCPRFEDWDIQYAAKPTPAQSIMAGIMGAGR
jgi:hypothetical protein